jgi:glycosyltransferase involved in cell wall biosynthesis
MGAWCWESAHALAEAGESVLLVSKEGLPLPSEPRVPVFRFDPLEGAVKSKFQNALALLSGSPASFLPELDSRLRTLGCSPRAYLLNQTNLHSPTISVPQYVVGWVGDSGLSVYLRSVFRIAGWRPSRRLARCFIECVGWYRKDWRGYRAACGVLAVTRKLADGLTIRGVPAYVVHPGTALGVQETAASRPDSRVRIITAALDLDDPRKQVRFLLNAIRQRRFPAMTLTLAGRASDRLRADAADVGIPVDFSGLLSREKLNSLCASHDIFFFGSRSDDWGYVLVEALACGLWIVAPRRPPFDEIVGDCGALFDPHSTSDAADKLSQAIADYDPSFRAKARDRAARLFSRRAFATQIQAALGAP